MDDFNKVGRLQRPQFLPSTRGFGLDGKEIIFKTPIKPKPYRKRRKRAKQGKIVFDNAQARWYRNQNLYGSQRGARIFRNSQNVGLNEDERGLTRPDLDRRIILQIERAEENRLDRDLERLEERIAPQRNLRRRPQPIALPDGRIPIPLQNRPLRENALDNNEARGVIANDVDRDSISIDGIDSSSSDAPSPLAPLLRSVDSDDTVSIADTEKTLEEVLNRQQSIDPNEPTEERRARGGRDLPRRNYIESDQESASDDSNFQDPQNTTNPEFVELSNTLSREKEEQRQIAIRRDIEEDKRANESFRQRRKPTVEESDLEPEPEFGAGVGGNIGETVDASEREVRRELGNDPTLDDRAEERKQSREGGNIFKRGLSRTKQKARDLLTKGKGEGEVFRYKGFDDVSDNAQLGLNPQFVSNPMNEDNVSEISSEDLGNNPIPNPLDSESVASDE